MSGNPRAGAEVKKRAAMEVHRVLSQPKMAGDVQCVQRQIRVAERHPLGAASGPASVEKASDVIAARPGIGHRLDIQEWPIQRPMARWGVQLPGQRARLRSESRVMEEDSGRAVAQHLPHLGEGEARIDRRDDPAGPERRVIGFQIAGRAFGEDRDPLARNQTLTAQERREPRDTIGEDGPAQFLAGGQDGRGVRRLLAGARNALRQPQLRPRAPMCFSHGERG